MCTISWVHGGGGYQLLCNRDEKKTRLPAGGPEIRSVDGVRYVAPVDGDFGGSWIAVNEFGVTLALLNRHRVNLHGTESRGRIVTDLAGVRSVEEARQQLMGLGISRFTGFTLAALEPRQPASLFEWDGERLTHSNNAEHRMPLTSSSFDSEVVQVKRHQQFSTRARARNLDAGLLFEFHRSHGLPNGKASAYSTCMHRPDAHTVSFTWIDVTESDVRFFYSPAAPCQWAPGETVQLARKGNSLALCG